VLLSIVRGQVNRVKSKARAVSVLNLGYLFICTGDVRRECPSQIFGYLTSLASVVSRGDAREIFPAHLQTNTMTAQATTRPPVRARPFYSGPYQARYQSMEQR
jgi:hypothetical protein